FIKAKSEIDSRVQGSAGLLATNSIRHGKNQEVLEKIIDTGNIFMAWSDRAWILDGAAVRVSIIGFSNQKYSDIWLNGELAESINSDLTNDLDIRKAKKLKENRNLAFQGPAKVGPFELDQLEAEGMLKLPNIHNKPHSDVIVPWLNGVDVIERNEKLYIIDFDMLSLEDASCYEAPFEYVKKYVKPIRDTNREPSRKQYWWRLGRTGSTYKKARTGKQKVIFTPKLSKYRLFTFEDARILPSATVIAIALDTDYAFGVLSSDLHVAWSIRIGSWLGAGNDLTYTPTTCFSTFPFPWPPGQESTDDPRVHAIAVAAQALVTKRDNWLNPPGLSEKELKKRTLTNLYNQRPTWLDLAHKKLDKAVLVAYGWSDLMENEDEAIDEQEVLARLLALNLERAGK
ncbi:MAG: type IIL restriction-modification enzyme MmeI, partial [Chloroflexota bacterium]